MPHILLNATQGWTVNLVIDGQDMPNTAYEFTLNYQLIKIILPHIKSD